MMSLIDWIIEPLQYSFVLRALLASMIVGMVCSVVGTYVILRGMAFFGDALAHTILPGVVISFIVGWPLAVGALIMGVLTAIGIGALSSHGLLKEDTAIGVIFAGAFALGVAILSATGNYTADLTHFLFGNLLGVSNQDLVVILVLGTIVLAAIALLYKEFLVISFDPVLATTQRLPVTFLRYALLLLIAVTIVVSLQVVGISLMMAMLVTPAAAASLLTKRLLPMMIVSAVIGTISSVVGLYISFYLDITSGPAIVLLATAIFVLAFLFAPERGVAWRRRS